MSRKHRGLGKGLDALIPRRSEIEQEFSHVGESTSQVFFSDDPEEQEQIAIPEIKPEDALQSDSKIITEISSENSSENIPETVTENEPEPETEPVSEIAAEVSEITAEKEEPSAEPAVSKEGVKTVRISQIEPNRGQPRRTFDEEALQELADSIRQYGIITPLLVQDRGDYYEIIAGERRWRAAMKAGINEVPVIVRDDEEKQVLEISLIENIQREDLNPMEEARAFRELMDKYGMTQEDVSMRISRSRSSVANTLRLLKLDERVQQMLMEGKISMGHARALLALDSKELQYSTAQEIESKELSVRETENLIRKLLKSKNDKGKEAKTADAEEKKLQIIYKNLEEQLCQKLGTKVSINAKKNGSGRLQIDFYSYDDLEKMIDKLS